MATWDTAYWESPVESGVPRGDRRSGVYSRYLPDRLESLSLHIDSALARQVANAERAIRRLNGPAADGLAGIARFLIRSEAIASSRIEGLAPSPQQVAFAEFDIGARGITAQARLVANNLTVVQRSTSEMAQADEVTVEQITALHASLLPDEPQLHGLRTRQNWIGGSDWHPIDAEFVPPAHNIVASLMDDLVDYLNGAAHSPLIQAALVHAQFETIHPFADGNGRVGRALIHTVLARRGLTERAVLPISLVLATLREDYVHGLTAYRHTQPAGSPYASEAIAAWLQIFVGAAQVAVDQSELLVEQINDLREEWIDRLETHRASTGVRATPRAGSAVSRLLERLPEAPVLTVKTAQELLEVTYPAALAALDELAGAEVLRRRRVEGGAYAYSAKEVLDLVTIAERRLASTKFDTRTSKPVRSVPASPH